MDGFRLNPNSFVLNANGSELNPKGSVLSDETFFAVRNRKKVLQEMVLQAGKREPLKGSVEFFMLFFETLDYTDKNFRRIINPQKGFITEKSVD